MIVALDVGGSSIKAGLVEPGDSLTPVGEVTRTALDHTAAVDRLVAAFAEAISSVAANRDDIGRIAIAVPDPFDHRSGVSLMRHKFASLYGHRIGADIATHLRAAGHPSADAEIGWCNDAAAAVAGEAIAGAARAATRVFGITLGTGLGAAFVVGGRVVDRIGDDLVVGDLYQRMAPSGARADDALSARAYMARAERGETPTAFGAELAEFLEPVVARLEPDVVVVGGGALASFDAFAPTLRAGVSVPVVAARLDRWAPLIGAAALTEEARGVADDQLPPTATAVRPQGLEP